MSGRRGILGHDTESEGGCSLLPVLTLFSCAAPVTYLSNRSVGRAVRRETEIVPHVQSLLPINWRTAGSEHLW